MDVLLETHPPPPLETSRTFFDFIEAPGALFIFQPLRLIVVPGPDNEHTHIYLKYKYTHENAGFCALCIDDFKILKIFNKLSKFSTIFHRGTSQAPDPPPPSPPQRLYDVSRGQNRYVTLP